MSAPVQPITAVTTTTTPTTTTPTIPTIITPDTMTCPVAYDATAPLYCPIQCKLNEYAKSKCIKKILKGVTNPAIQLTVFNDDINCRKIGNALSGIQDCNLDTNWFTKIPDITENMPEQQEALLTYKDKYEKSEGILQTTQNILGTSNKAITYTALALGIFFILVVLFIVIFIFRKTIFRAFESKGGSNKLHLINELSTLNM